MSPLISIMIPCYNARQTLPRALASLLAQTWENWECVLVDDGSTDNPLEIVEAVGDERIHFLQHKENRGRGAARQTALTQAKGDYLCMLDADDWLYPGKLERQVTYMESHPEVALVSAGMAIVDEQDCIVGVRSQGAPGSETRVLGPFNQLRMPPVAHAPSMIRMSIAKNLHYDSRFLLAQDVDFLLRVLLDRYYAILPEITYVYSEPGSTTLTKILAALAFTRQMFWKYKDRFPLASRVNIVKAYAKSLIYWLSFNLGFGNRMISRRSQVPSAAQIAEFEKAKQIITNEMEKRIRC